MFQPLRFVKDLAVALALVAAVSVVFVLDRPSATAPADPGLAPPPAPARLAATPSEHDDLSKLLRQLGAGFRHDELALDDLADAQKLARYDAVFLTCGKLDQPRPAWKASLREYVAKGGTLYASDLRFDVIADAFPEYVDQAAVSQGKKGSVAAQVLDPGLLDDLGGDQLQLQFDENDWRPAAFGGDQVAVLVRGLVQSQAGVALDVPLLVRFKHGAGTVVFTSFHSEKQGSRTPEVLLRYLVLATVTAKLQSQVEQQLSAGGFAPPRRSLMTVDRPEQVQTRTYTNLTPGRLRFTLSFPDETARLGMVVTDPAGRVVAEQEGTSTFHIDVANAAAGKWQCTVKPLQVLQPLTFGVNISPEQKTKAEPPAPPVVRVVDDVKYERVALIEAAPAAMQRRLAVTPALFDDMGRLLRLLGPGYDPTDIPYQDLLDFTNLSKFDVVFLTCSGLPDEWLTLKDGVIRGRTSGSIKPQVGKRLQAALGQYVQQGGTLYASDLHLATVARAFPQFIDESLFFPGEAQDVEALVTDPGLRDRLGERLPLHFDKPDWRPAALKAPQMAVYLRGEYLTTKGDRKTAPLLVKIPAGKGSIFFTSFHNEKANRDKELDLLRYLVFDIVTAKVQTAIQLDQEKGGFSPKHQEAAHFGGDTVLPRVFKNTSPRRLRFVLGIDNPGARFEFKIIPPRGHGPEFKHEVTSTFGIEVPHAPAGDWTLQVKSLHVPYVNFPCALGVYEIKESE